MLAFTSFVFWKRSIERIPSIFFVRCEPQAEAPNQHGAYDDSSKEVHHVFLPESMYE